MKSKIKAKKGREKEARVKQNNFLRKARRKNNIKKEMAIRKKRKKESKKEKW